MDFSKGFVLDGSEESFNKIFFKYLTASSAKGIDNINFDVYKSKVNENSNLISRKIKDGTYKFSNYAEKLILKGRNNKPRVISIPTIRDKVVLKYIQLVLKEQCEDIKQSLPQVHIQEFKDNVASYNYVVKLDLKKYYDNINHNILEEILKAKGIDSNIIDLINKAITRPTINKYQLSNKRTKKERNTIGTPQGLSISNILAAIYIYEIDNTFKNKANVKYIRYVDDILILCDRKDAKLLREEITEKLMSVLKLEVHSNGDKVYTHGLDENVDLCFLGYNYRLIHDKFNGFTVKDENLFKFENSIVNIFTRFDSDKRMSEEEFIFRLNNKITGSISRNVDTDSTRESRYGWLFFYSQIDDYTILFRLDKLVSNLLNRFKRCSSIQKSRIKEFGIAFKEIKCNIRRTDYIHKPDELDSHEKRELLINTFNISAKVLIDKSTIDKYYYMNVYKPIKLSQKDIQQTMS